MTRRSSRPNGERVTRSSVRKRYLPAPGSAPASGPAPVSAGDAGEEDARRQAASTRRRSGRAGTSVVLDEQRQRRGPAAVVLERVVEVERVAREDVGGHPARRPGACRSIAALAKIEPTIGPAASPATSRIRLICWCSPVTSSTTQTAM